MRTFNTITARIKQDLADILAPERVLDRPEELATHENQTLASTPLLKEIISKCLMCGACAVTCPSGINHYERFMEMREKMMDKKQNQIRDSRADLWLTDCPVCRINLAGNLEETEHIKVCHPAVPIYQAMITDILPRVAESGQESRG